MNKIKQIWKKIQIPFTYIEKFFELGGFTKSIIFLVISGISVILSLIFSKAGIDTKIDIAWISIILCGLPIIADALCGLVLRFDIKADVLVAIALISSLFINEYFAAGEVALIMQLGEFLEELTVLKAHAGLEKLVKLSPKEARLIVNNLETMINIEDVKIDDTLKVLPGEIIPVDGIIIDGSTSINQAVMTGESLPVDKTVGDEVSSGTINQFGAFTMKATKVGVDSSIQRMVKLVESADASKAKVVSFADKMATWVVIIALSAAIITGIISNDIVKSVTILVVFCPCSLVLATPTAIMAAIGNVTKHGFIVKNGDALERLSKCKVITFDKTGTLTYGEPEVIHVESVSDKYSSEEIYNLVAIAEKNSTHPLANAIVKSFEEKYSSITEQAINFEMIPGEGIKSRVKNNIILAGNTKLLANNGVSIKETNIEKYLNIGATCIHIAIDSAYVGFIALSDKVREESIKTIESLNNLGISPVLLTGDNENSAKEISSKLGITNYVANCLPEDKMKYISENSDNVCMIGDGINDAPALKSAYVGIAMGGIGSDIAVEASDIVLVNDEINELPHLVSLSKRMMITIIINIIFSMTLNFTAIALSILSLLNPVTGALVHNAGSVLVIVNSALLLTYKQKK